MSDILKFPNDGYNVTVCRKQDILDCIDENIIDKEIALAIVTQCEIDATNFLKEGRWAGIPFLGSMRISKHKLKFNAINGDGLLEDAKQELDKNRYILFRKNLNAEIEINIKRERLYRYETSGYVLRHRKIYTYLLKDKRANKLNDKEVFARFMCYSYIQLSSELPID